MPTPKKLRDARQKGQVCTSKDVVSTALLVVLMALSGVMAMKLTDDFSELMRFIGMRIAENDTLALRETSKMAIWVTCWHSFVFVAVAALVGVVANMVQIGFLFTFEPLKPDLKKINPAEGAKKIFSMKNIFEFLKNCVKVTFLGYLVYRLVEESIPALLPVCYGTLDDIYPVMKTVMLNLAFYTAFGYIVIAVVDRLFRQKNFTKQMIMTKDEVKALNEAKKEEAELDSVEL